MTDKLYLAEPFVIDHAASPRFGDPSTTEVRRYENYGHYRCIGGNRGDLYFDGYEVKDGKTILANAAVITFFDNADITEDELTDLAREIFDEAFASIGIECVEHS
jgi:hypothetical protein